MLHHLKKARWLLAPLTILLVDATWIWGTGGLLTSIGRPANLIASLLMSLLFWFGLSRVLAFLNRGKIWAVVTTLPISLAISASWMFERRRGYALGTDEVTYVFYEPASASNLISQDLDGLFFLTVLFLWGALIVALRPTERAEFPKERLVLYGGLIALSFGMAAYIPPPLPYNGRSVSDFTTVSLLSASAQHLMNGTREHEFSFTRRDRPPTFTAKQRPSVLIFIGESLRPDRMSAFGTSEHDTTPFLRSFADSDRTFVLPNAYSPTASTDYGLIALLLGYYHTRPMEHLEKAPAIWHVADAAGYRTSIVSTQSWDWANLNAFLIGDSPPDHFVHASNSGFEVVNDTGIDDRDAARIAAEYMRSVPTDEPLVQVFQSNATHYFYLEHEDADWTRERPVDRYDASLRVVDQAFEILVQGLRDSGRLDSTLIFFTSDHSFFNFGHVDDWETNDNVKGEFVGSHTSSCEPIATRVPFVVRVPSGLGMELDTHRLTSTLDIPATLYDIWGVQEPIDGEPINAPRGTLPLCFTGSHPGPMFGFSVIDAERSIYLRTNVPHPHVYDLTDPKIFSERYLGGPLGATDRQRLKEVMASQSILQTAWTRMVETRPELASWLVE